MDIPSIISRKRDGQILSDAQINLLVEHVADRKIHPVQLGAFLMAVFLKGMNRDETISLTKAMVKNGETLQWPEEWRDLVVDKHSTGGVGDKVSLPLAPALASLGLKVPMISGRGLGFTGGTLDKLESIPGFNINLTSSEICTIVDKIGCCIVGQTEKIAPADKAMYAARDVSATINCISLIVSSIIAKKAAENPKALVFDVKCGIAAFMKNEEDAQKLAKWLVNTAQALDIKTVAVLTKMNEPIGMMIGNSVEVIESIQCLKGNAPKDLEELICTQGGSLLLAKGKVANLKDGYDVVLQTLKNGKALLKFKEMLIAQNVDKALAEKLCEPGANLWELLPLAKECTNLIAESSGIVHSLNALDIANVLLELGAGRLHPDDSINHGVSLVLKTHKGASLNEGDVWGVVYHDEEITTNQLSTFKKSLSIGNGESNENSYESRIIEVIKPTF